MRLIGSMCACILFLFPAPLGAQQKEKPKWPPSPHIAATDPLRPEEQIKKFQLPPGFEMQLVAGRAGYSQADQHQLRRRRPALGDRDDRVSVRRQAGQGPRRRQDPRRLRPRRPGTQDHHVCRRAQHPHRRLAAPTAKEALVLQHPEHLRTDRHQRRPARPTSAKLLYSGFGHHDTHGMTGEFTRGFDGWIYACHGFSNTSEVRARDGKQRDHHALGQHLSLQARRLARRAMDARPGQSVRPGLRSAGNLYSADCHTPADLPAAARRLVPSFGKPHDGLGFGPEMMTHDHGFDRHRAASSTTRPTSSAGVSRQAVSSATSSPTASTRIGSSWTRLDAEGDR